MNGMHERTILLSLLNVMLASFVLMLLLAFSSCASLLASLIFAHAFCMMLNVLIIFSISLLYEGESKSIKKVSGT